MPIIRVDVPEGSTRAELLALRRRIEEAIARTWAKDHIYVAIHPMIAEAADRSAIVTVDLRKGRGEEAQRSVALYRELLQALRLALNTEADRFVLLVREFEERCFVVDGGKALPPLEEITPPIQAPA